MDQGASALDMIAHFVYNLPLATKSQEDSGPIVSREANSWSSLARPLRIGKADGDRVQSSTLMSTS